MAEPSYPKNYEQFSWYVIGILSNLNYRGFFTEEIKSDKVKEIIRKFNTLVELERDKGKTTEESTTGENELKNNSKL